MKTEDDDEDEDRAPAFAGPLRTRRHVTGELLVADLWHKLAALKRIFQERGDPLPARAQVGRKGEQAAARFLERKGYRILERNFRTLRGEIDLIAFRDGTLAFVEVRSQTLPAEMDPVYTVTRRKQARVIRAAHAFCAGWRPIPPDTILRFDIVTVRFPVDGTEPEIRHMEGAFEAPGRGFS